jgi:hypothetical protein
MPRIIADFQLPITDLNSDVALRAPTDRQLTISHPSVAPTCGFAGTFALQSRKAPAGPILRQTKSAPLPLAEPFFPQIRRRGTAAWLLYRWIAAARAPKLDSQLRQVDPQTRAHRARGGRCPINLHLKLPKLAIDMSRTRAVARLRCSHGRSR